MRYSHSFGGASILAIFVLLSLTIFATLAVASASASERLAVRVAAASDAYYAADSRAEEILADISEAARAPGGNAHITGRVRYSVPIDEMRALHVELEICDTGQDVRIAAWKVVALGPNTPLETPALWAGWIGGNAHEHNGFAH